MHPTKLGTLFKRAGICGDSKYHHEFKTGLKGTSQRYKMVALDELYRRTLKGVFQGVKPNEMAKLENYLKIREVES